MFIVSMTAYANPSCRQVVLYTYHNKPPFITSLEKEEGLYFDLATLLNSRSANYHFSTAYIPRKRLDYMIASDKLDGVVVGVSPTWFADDTETRFLWLPPLFVDRDEFVSLASTPFEYQDPASLEGKTMAGVAGFYYMNINEAVAAGELLRVNTIGEREVLELVAKGRVDFGIVSRSVFSYLQRKHQLSSTFHFSEQPHDAFTRRAFTSPQQHELHDELQRLMAGLQDDPAWQAMKARYRSN
ncbi:substrate-binding periplasmic protein [Alteromonas sp. CYL-A6]|uniref:substrate-binding periplasmic protein n=1 Tax=Alteromonas nitratireducens TaxID=3390813 RepID=UPI0034AC7942